MDRKETEINRVAKVVRDGLDKLNNDNLRGLRAMGKGTIFPGISDFADLKVPFIDWKLKLMQILQWIEDDKGGVADDDVPLSGMTDEEQKIILAEFDAFKRQMKAR